MRRPHHHRLYRVVAPVASGFAVVMLRSSEALACPDCATAQVVRSSVFDGSFWTNLTLISTPLVVLGVIAALLLRIGSERAT